MLYHTLLEVQNEGQTLEKLIPQLEELGIKIHFQNQFNTQSNPSNLQKKEGLFFKVKNRLEKIYFEDILWVQASDIYSIIRTKKARFLVSHTLKVLEEKFPKQDFARVHRSFLVKIEEIVAIEESDLIIEGEYIPIGQTYKDAFYKRLDFMR